MAVITASIILAKKILLAIISFIISYGLLIIKVIICYGTIVLTTFFLFKNFAAIGEKFDLLAFLDRLFQESLQCDFTVRDGQITDDNSREINNVANQMARMLGL